MKFIPLKWMVCTLACLPWLASGDDLHTFTYNNVNLNIPDRGQPGAGSGVVNNQVVAGLAGTIITGIQISLNLVAGVDLNGQTNANNGDYYVSLVHTVGTTTEGFSVLLNRSGVTSLNGAAGLGGYYDNGFNVTFSDTAANDIHFYQNADYTLNGDGQLTGTWQPDGENINPESDPSAFDDAAANQTALLNSFLGYGADGTWSLFLFDAESGGAGELTNWSLAISTVPEPGTVTLLVTAVLAAVLRCTFFKK